MRKAASIRKPRTKVSVKSETLPMNVIRLSGSNPNLKHINDYLTVLPSAVSFTFCYSTSADGRSKSPDAYAIITRRQTTRKFN